MNSVLFGIRRVAGLAVGAFAFCLLAILNCGGYRYGVGDQASYIPSINTSIPLCSLATTRCCTHKMRSRCLTPNI